MISDFIADKIVTEGLTFDDVLLYLLILKFFRVK